MTADSYRFDRFMLDRVNRQLFRDDSRLDINARYFDALALLVAEQGKLVTKDRFLEEVWRGVPVTDEALTQCIKTLRRQLGDDASRPRFIETVPKHGYRFIAAAMEPAGTLPVAAIKETFAPHGLQYALLTGAAGTIGGGLAGLIGGVFYGFAGASQPLAPGMGAVSILLVLVCLTILMAVIGGAGVAFGISLSRFVAKDQSTPWMIVGGAAGGMLVGAVVKLLGLDAFNLLLGQSPGDITGAGEGAILGGAVGLGLWLAQQRRSRFRLRGGSLIAAAIGGGAGLAIVATGGRLMGGSLDLLAQSLSESRLRLDQIGGLFGEHGFGLASQFITAGLEGALFAGFVVAAMMVAQRNLGE